MIERRTGGELRAEGRRLSGTVMAFGDVSPSHRERFEAGAFRFADAVPLNLHHDPERAVAWQPGGGLELRQDRAALTMTANLPPIPAADRALAMVRAGQASGLSIEFRAVRERHEDGLRVVEAATLTGIGIVRSPSYGGSRVEARARSGRTLRASIPYDRELACECIRQSGPGSGGLCVPIVKFNAVAGEFMARAIASPDGEVLAVFKDYSRPLGSARRGTLRASSGAAGLDLEIDLPTGEAGDTTVSASETAGVIARPLVDYDRSEFTDTETGRVVERPFLRAVLIGSTDAREGWPDARIDYEGERAEARSRPCRRRVWL